MNPGTDPAPKAMVTRNKNQSRCTQSIHTDTGAAPYCRTIAFQYCLHCQSHSTAPSGGEHEQLAAVCIVHLRLALRFGHNGLTVFNMNTVAFL